MKAIINIDEISKRGERNEHKQQGFFIQIRCGRDGKEFRFYKFRTMCVDAEDKLQELLELNEVEGPAFKIKEDPRMVVMGMNVE